MPKYSAKQRQLRGQRKHSGRNFIQLFHSVKRSTSYHGLSPLARALLIELIDRHNGINNGMIALGVREAAYELKCSQGSISNAARELDDAGLARAVKIGAWRGRHATEWRLMWLRCYVTGDLPRHQWQERRPYVQLLLPKPKRKALTNAERQQLHRDRLRNEKRNDEFSQESAEVQPGERRSLRCSATRAQNGNSSINVTEPSSAREAHLHVYQGEGGTGSVQQRDGGVAEVSETKPEQNQGTSFAGGLLAQLTKHP